MARKGLNREKVVAAALQLVEEKGYDNFALRELAAYLGIKAASLYNYIENIDDLYMEIGTLAGEALMAKQRQAAAGLDKAEALEALAMAQRDFVFEHPELYKALMALSDVERRHGIKEITPHISGPTMEVLALYGLTEEQRVNWQRIIRSTFHGFTTYEQAGWFMYYNVPPKESYLQAVRHFAAALEAVAAANEKERQDK